MASVIGAEALVVEAKRNRSGTASPDVLAPESIGQALRLVLAYLLSGIDYEDDVCGDGAMSARMIASLIACADEIMEAGRPH